MKIKNNMEKRRLKAISLFSGCGGDTLGLEKAGLEVVGFVEFWNKAIETHKLNFPNSKFIGEKFKGDITKIPDEEFLETNLTDNKNNEIIKTVKTLSFVISIPVLCLFLFFIFAVIVFAVLSSV